MNLRQYLAVVFEHRQLACPSNSFILEVCASCLPGVVKCVTDVFEFNSCVSQEYTVGERPKYISSLGNSTKNQSNCWYSPDNFSSAKTANF